MGFDTRLIKERATQRARPQTGVEQSQGMPYAILPPSVQREFTRPGDPGINQRGWVNPYKLVYYGFQAPDQSSDSSIMALQGNMKRVYLGIQNKGPGNLFVNFGTEAFTDGLNCLALVPTQFFEFVGGGGVFPDGNTSLATTFVPRDSIYILADAADTTCVIGEGIWTNTKPVR